jgi:hypothetical protein
MPRLPADLTRRATLAEDARPFRTAQGSWMTGTQLEQELLHAAAMQAAARRHGPVPTKPRAEKTAWDKLVEDRETFAHVARRMVGK